MGTVYAVILRRVIDATRLDVACDFSAARCSQRVRVFGVRTAKAGTPAGDQAHAWVMAWLAQHAPAQPPAVWVTIATPRPPRFARYPAIIHAPDGACLNRDLLDSGHARPT